MEKQLDASSINNDSLNEKYFRPTPQKILVEKMYSSENEDMHL